MPKENLIDLNLEEIPKIPKQENKQENLEEMNNDFINKIQPENISNNINTD